MNTEIINPGSCEHDVLIQALLNTLINSMGSYEHGNNPGSCEHDVIIQALLNTLIISVGSCDHSNN
jgi:hypothetical protein